MKALLKLVVPVTGRSGLVKYIFLGILSGLCSFLFINSVNRVISLVIADAEAAGSTELILLFAAIIFFIVWIRRTLALSVIALSQRIFWRLRDDIVSLVLHSDYRQLAGRKDKVQASIVNDINVLTSASMSIIDFSTSLIMALSCLVYLGTISFTLFLITLGIALLGIGVYQLSARKNIKQFHQSRDLENKFVKNVNDILHGFKEIFIAPGKGRFIYEQRIKPDAAVAYSNNKKALTGFLNNQMIGQILFYILISSVVLVFARMFRIGPGGTVSFVFTLLYLLSAIETIMALLPGLVRAKVASVQMLMLKEELRDGRIIQASAPEPAFKAPFSHIDVREVHFSYDGKENVFGIGPVSMEIAKGDVIFIYGGNGSGKTTFIHTLLGLSTPDAGEIWLNGTRVNAGNAADYKAAFAVVFSDFYLFDGLPGIDEIDMEKWTFYLELFELEKKVTLTDGCFSTTDLSAGQRKRLALIAALMENKPLLVLDEWAADQDPYFRKKFYTEIIPLFKRKGITVIAITHDDRYYDCADKLYKMEYGKLSRQNISDAALFAVG
jgi:putative pyoverdin transport system ATP-binding/permease protein